MSEHYNTYVGARYVPIFDGDWDNTKSYEPLVIVSYQGDSYTSKTYVPSGAPITNTTYWAKTGNYNAQVEQLSNHVVQLDNKVNEFEYDIQDFREAIDGYNEQFTTINTHLTTLDGRCDQLDNDISGAVDTLNSRINTEVATLNSTISGNVSNITNALSGLSNHVDTEVQRIDNEISQIEISGGFVTPEMYGAVGDGQTDDTVALKNCFADACANKLIVRGVGRYKVSATQTTATGYTGVLVPSPVTMIGMYFILADNCPEKSTILTCKYGSGTYKFIDCEFYMTGDGYDETHTSDVNGYSAVLFMAENSFNNRAFLNTSTYPIYFKNCKFVGCLGYSVYITAINNAAYFTDCKFSPRGEGIVCYNRQLFVDNCSIEPYENSQTHAPALVHDNLSTLQIGESNCIFRMTNCRAAIKSRLFDHYQLAGEKRYYDEFSFTNCYSAAVGVVISTNDSVVFNDGCVINNCEFHGNNDFLGNTGGTTETLKVTDSHFASLEVSARTVEMHDTWFGYVKGLLTNLYLYNCSTQLSFDGAIRSPSAARINMSNIIINGLTADTTGNRNRHLIKNVTFDRCYINDLVYTGAFENNQIIENSDVSQSNNNIAIIKGFVYSSNTSSDVVTNVHSVVLEYSGEGYISVYQCTRQKIQNVWFD